MAQGLGLEWSEKPQVKDTEEKKTSGRAARKNVEGRAMGSRRIFAPHFKLKVLDSYRQDSDCRGNQRATARKYGIHRRQIQKWLQVEASLRTTVELGPASDLSALNLCGAARLRDDTGTAAAAAAGESQASSQHCSNLIFDQRPPIHPASSAHVDDAIRPAGAVADNQEVKKEVTVSLFPSVKIEPLETKSDSHTLISTDRNSNFSEKPLNKSASIELFPSVKVEDSSETQGLDLNIDDFKEEPLSDEDEMMVPSESEQALDFTCAALSKRRSFSLQFKLEVLNAFHSDKQCLGNQRATARKYGINRRQVQKWLHQEVELRGETTSRGGLYRQRLGRWMDSGDARQPEENLPNMHVEPNCTSTHLNPPSEQCWDLSNKKRKAEPPMNVAPYKKRSLELLKQQNDDCDDVTSSGENDLPDVQETALCLVKVKHVPKELNEVEEKSISNLAEVSSSADINRVVGQALYHSNHDHIIPPYVPLPPLTLPPHSFYCFPHQPLHHMFDHYRGFVIHR